MPLIRTISIFSISFVLFFCNIQGVRAQCPGTDSISVSIPVCVNQSITFTNNSTGGADTYDYDWGDSSSKKGVGSRAAQKHTYTSVGTYTAYVVRHFTSNTP